MGEEIWVSEALLKRHIEIGNVPRTATFSVRNVPEQAVTAWRDPRKMPFFSNSAIKFFYLNQFSYCGPASKRVYMVG
jgi:hypothetical protein